MSSNQISKDGMELLQCTLRTFEWVTEPTTSCSYRYPTDISGAQIHVVC